MTGKTGIIAAGGDLSPAFAEQIISEYISRGGVYLAAADAGLEVLHAAGRVPDLVLGDFDTVKGDILSGYRDRAGVRVETHNPVKDASDLELAVDALLSEGIRDAAVLGALGGRADHTLANIRLTFYAAQKGMRLTILEPGNRIRCFLAGKEGEERKVSIRREEQWGRYVGIFPIGGRIGPLSLEGFRYPLRDFFLDDGTPPSLTISNEITEETGVIRFSGGPGSGILVVESGDRQKK